eukprot:TRINITY_DN13125_c0_g1_i6.p2 TRINITY_DN13125_c0_g1~~TRINITY_DN13125_c0_g1_i6.p2  ORF type:complete len:309 (-),score=112.13 TRINITY_DN13125_c0_g1_i6:97-1023(-)
MRASLIVVLALFAACALASCSAKITPQTVLLPATSEHAALEIQYAEYGRRSGPLILALHGFTDSWYSFELLMQQYHSAHIVAMTLPCYGTSTKDATVAADVDKMGRVVMQFIDKMRLGAIDVVMGHSMSTVLATRLAQLHPDVFGGVVLMGSFAYMNEDLKGAFNAIAADVVAQNLGDDGHFGHDYCWTWQTGTTNMELVPEWFLEGCTQQAMMVPGKCWLAGVQYLTTVNITDILPLVTRPVLIVYGDGDFIAPANGGIETMFEGLPNMNIVKLHGLGHAPHWEAPDEVAFAVDQFVDTIEHWEDEA